MINYKAFKKQTIIKSIKMDHEDNCNQVAIYMNKEENNDNQISLIDNFIFENNKVSIVVDKNNDTWFKAKDVAVILEYENTTQAIVKNVDEEDKKKLENLKPNKNLSYNEKNTIYINKKGLESLLMKSRKIYEDDLINDMITKLDLNLNHIIKTKEQDSLGKIINVFKSLNYKTQFQIDNYKIDLYFLDYKLAIECDENGHKAYDLNKEIERENFIKSQLNCTFIRFNPDAKDFNIFNVIQDIFVHVHNYKNK